MSMSYVAFFADDELSRTMNSIRDWRAEAQETLFDPLEKSKRTLIFGATTDGWVFSSVAAYLHRAAGVAPFGCALGRSLASRCSFLEWLLPAPERRALLQRMKKLTPRKDASFRKSVLAHLKDVPGYADSFKESPDDWLQLFDGLLATLEMADDMGGSLVVMIPH